MHWTETCVLCLSQGNSRRAGVVALLCDMNAVAACELTSTQQKGNGMVY